MLNFIKVVPFSDVWVPTLCSWIKNLNDLVYWSGNTFSKQSFTTKIFSDHLRKAEISPFAGLNDKGTLVAYGEIVRNKCEDRLNLCRIIVHPNQRGRGIGKRFTKVLIDKIQVMESCKSVRLNVLSSNHRAIACYSSLGFKKYGIIPRARRVGKTELDLIIMSKTLDFKINEEN